MSRKLRGNCLQTDGVDGVGRRPCAVDAAMAYQPHAVGATPRRRVREIYTSPPRRRRDYRELTLYTTHRYSTPKVLTMEFIESFKLTDIERVEREGLDRKDLAKRVADTFLYQIVDTAYFHCDPHPGNLAVDTKGNLVYYDFGMMDELSPNVKAGFKEFCFALFEGALAASRRVVVPSDEVVSIARCRGWFLFRV